MNEILDQKVKDSGLRQIFICKAVGIDPAMLWHYINGHRQPRVDRALKLAKILNSTVEELFLKGEKNDADINTNKRPKQ